MYATGEKHIEQLQNFQKSWRPSASIEVRRANETLCYVFEEYLPDSQKNRTQAIELINSILETSLAVGVVFNKKTGYLRITVEHENPGLKPKT